MYGCPCCNNKTFPVEPREDMGFICPVCWWENDSFISSDDEPSDQNHGLTLNQARAYYNKCGLSDPNLAIRWAEGDTRPWSQLILLLCEKAEAFEIHCWSDEREEIALALRYGALKDTGWSGGKVIAGRVTGEFKAMLSSRPKPAPSDCGEVYDKKTPFFSIFFDNGFSVEHYGTEINCSLLRD